MRRSLTIAAFLFLAADTLGAQTVSFRNDIQPILEANCLKCHGAAIQLSKLDLRTREAALTGGAHGAAITPGNPDASKLYRMVAGLEKPAMPMGGKLDPAAVDKIRRWIAEGAPWDASAVSAKSSGSATDLEKGDVPPEARNYWAFRKPVRPPVPDTAGNPVDAFIRQTLKARGLTQAPRADRTTLVRRAYLVLL
jgi:hypothetical protein